MHNKIHTYIGSLGDIMQMMSVQYAYRIKILVLVAVCGGVLVSQSVYAQSQEGFRFRSDDGGESTASWLVEQDEQLVHPLNTTARFRAVINGTTTATTTRFGLQYKVSSSSSWYPVGVDTASPIIAATSSARDTGNATAHTATLPAGTQVGDLIVVMVSCDGGTLINEEPGWNRSYVAYNTTLVSSAVFWHFATTTSPALIFDTAASEECSHIGYRLTGAGVPQMIASDGSSTNSNPPNLNAVSSRPYLWITTRSGDSTVVATVAPTNYLNLISRAANTTGGASSNAAHRYLAATSTDPGTFTSAAEQWVSWTIAVPPIETPATKNVQVLYHNTLTGINSSATGSLAWSTPNNINSSNNARTTATMSSTTRSNFLIATSSGMNIPSNATITGVEVLIETLQSGGTAGTIQFDTVGLLKNGTTTGTRLTNGTAWTTTEKQYQFGSSSALWGTSWSPGDFNNGFGVSIVVRGVAADSNRKANIDHVIVLVSYTIPAVIDFGPSNNISASGASTTAQLLPPTGRTGSDFISGRIQDDENPTDSIYIPANNYTEIEWSLTASSAVLGSTYNVRVVTGTTTPLESYDVSAQWTMNQESVWNASDWTLFDTITIQEENIDATLTDFPVYVNLDDLSSTFWSTTPVGAALTGTDIRVTTATNVEVPRELVFASSTLGTGELHFKAPLISSTTDTVFKIWYNGTTTGNYTDSATYGAHNVWSNGYEVVQHLNEDGNTTSGGYKDSTGNNHDGTGTAMTGASDLPGQVGRGQDFDGVNNFINLNGSFALVSSTMSTWYKVGTFDYEGCDGLLFTRTTLATGLNTSCGTSWRMGYHWNDDSATYLWDGPTIYADVWNYVVLSLGGAEATVYNYSGNNLGSSTNVTTHATSTMSSLSIGADVDQDRKFNGQMDEVRVASLIRSTAWVKAEYFNQSTTTDFYGVNLGGAVGSSTIANHTAGQVNNVFTASDRTNESLFAFRLTPNSGNATVTEAVISLTGVQGFNPATTLSNLRLFRDIDNDAQYDVSDVAVGGTGVVTGSDQNGAITFTTDFLSTTSQNYLLVGDWAGLSNGSFATFGLLPTGLSIIDASSAQSVLGSVTNVQHSRNNKGGGGGSSASVGGGAPAGNGDVGGGGSLGGELIGSHPDFLFPAANSGSWTTGGNAYDQTDGTYATTNSVANHTYSNHGFAVPANNTVGGIEIRLELSGSTAAGTVDVQLSWDGGNSWSGVKSTPTMTTADAVRTLGSPSDLWGRSWSSSEFSNGNFVVRVTGNTSSNTIRLDALQVRVYHVAGGGGAGGGGGI